MISRCRNKLNDETSISDKWKDPMVACQIESAGIVKLTNRDPVCQSFTWDVEELFVDC